MRSLFSLLLSLSLLLSCQTITVRPDGGAGRLSSPPDWQKTQHFFMGGLIGGAVVPVGKICQGRAPLQLQSQTTFLNSLASAAVPLLGIAAGLVLAVALSVKDSPSHDPTSLQMTADGYSGDMTFLALPFAGFLVGSLLGYAPKTAKVWCGEGEKAL